MSGYQSIPLSLLYLDENNVRRVYSGIDELAGSIKEHGVLQNLIVIGPRSDGTYLVKAGNRRTKALLKLHPKVSDQQTVFVPCLVLPHGRTGDLEQIIENIHRDAAPPWRIGLKLLEIQEATGDRVTDLAERINKSPSYVSHMCKLGRQLHPSVIAKLDRLGATYLTLAKLLKISSYYDDETLEPDETMQLQELQRHVSGSKGARRKPTACDLPLKEIVFKRFSQLDKRLPSIPTRHLPTVRSLLAYLSGRQKRLSFEE